ncbi:MAG: hypothetical protein M3P39_04295 [Actinomycetota bacterium]|nr:hypothetical protein [Actinomycetota bacterium]
MSVMTTTLRRHGATMIERDGRLVVKHFGSPASEAAVCRSSVGLAERSDRATLELSGAPQAVDEALAEIGRFADAAWWVRRTPHRAIVRCEGAAADACTALMVRAEDVTVTDISADCAALDLVGPHAADVLRAHLEQEGRPVVLVVRRDAACVELLVARAHGPALWNGLLELGDPYGIACVGIEALEHLDVSERLTRRRAPRVPPG